MNGQYGLSGQGRLLYVRATPSRLSAFFLERRP